MRKAAAEILREYGPFPAGPVGGVTFDGQSIWFAAGGQLNSADPSDGTMQRLIAVPAEAGTTFDGQYLYQIAKNCIQKIEPETGRVVHTIPTPNDADVRDSSGLAWAEGTLWVGQYQGRKIYQIDAETGAILRTITSDRFVTGVTWVDGELWHATWEHEQSELRHIDPESGAVLEQLEMPRGVKVSGLESDGGDRFFCGGDGEGKSGMVRAVRRPKRADGDQSVGAKE